MARHKNIINNSTNKENDTKCDKNITEEITISKKIGINHSPLISPLFNGNILESKLLESEAKVSKLISEIDLLKKKVSFVIYFL